jgi:hypothetical protein
MQYKTEVEVEALTIYGICKGVDTPITITLEQGYVEQKSGGRAGRWIFSRSSARKPLCCMAKIPRQVHKLSNPSAV